jgi:hypothetical protein
MQNKKYIEKLKKLVDEHGLNYVSKLLGISKLKLARLSDMVIGDADIAYDIINLLFYDGELIKDFEHDGFNVVIGYDGLEGTVTWVIESKTTYYSEDDETEIITCYATPFWEGESNIPIDVTSYTIVDDNHDVIFEIEGEIQGDYYKNITIGSVYKNVDTLIEWYEEKYIPIVFNTVRNLFLPKLRERASKERDWLS